MFSHQQLKELSTGRHGGIFDLVGMEIDKDYYDAAVKRFNNHKAQLQLF